MSGQRTSGTHLSGSQRLVLKDMRTNGIVWLRGHYATTRYALVRKGLITFNDTRGMYEVTDKGRAALEEAC